MDRYNFVSFAGLLVLIFHGMMRLLNLRLACARAPVPRPPHPD